MDALLPSEIARLVLGYLQEQKCDEVAKMFLETSSHLQECRLVAQRGGRYSTKVGGLSLTDMLDKYCAANAIVQEKLNKVSDNEQVKYCNDITEQLRYLLEGSRGHRFVVNINVPTQNSPNGTFGTPSLSTSSRKRQHSGSDRGKRVVKSLINSMEKDAPAPVGPNCDTVEATPLESLPGHKPCAKQSRLESLTNNLINNKSPAKIDSTQNAAKESRSSELTSVGTQSDVNIVQNTQKHQSTETVTTSNLVQTPSKSTGGTGTEHPMNYCSTEVQTAPFDLFDTVHDINYEPLTNLSILTEELLHRTELAEQIAANINKSIIPIQENAHENPDANLSLLQGFDSAVKSAVETTDKVLEGLFNEIFTVADSDINLDQDSNGRNVELMDVDNNTESMVSQNGQQLKRPDVPLKQRLRSSSRSLINPGEDDGDCNALLENQNEEAIRSIVANVMASKQSSTTETEPESATQNSSPNENQEFIIPETEVPSTGNENIEPNKNANNAKPTKPRKNPRKPRTPKPKGLKILEKAEEIKLQEQNIVTMPTFILCSQNEMQTVAPIPAFPATPAIPAGLPIKTHGYLPIAPKPTASSAPTAVSVLEKSPSESAEPQIFLRTVHVPRHLVKPAQLEASAAANQLLMQLQASPQRKTLTSSASCSGSPIIVIADDKQKQQQQRSGGEGKTQGAESITLYGDDSNSEVRVPAPVASMPVISLDESISHLAVGTGLSPFFKGNVDAEMTTTTTRVDQPKVVVPMRKLDEVKDTVEKNDKVEKKLDDKEIEEDKKVDESEKNNPTIVVTVPDDDGNVSTDIESNTPEKVVEKKTEEKLTDVNKGESVSQVDESKVDDKTISSKSESKFSKKSVDVDKEKKIEEKKISKEEEKTVPPEKDTKQEEKSVPPKKDAKQEEKSVPPKKDSKQEEKSVPRKIEEKPVPVKKDIVPVEKPVVAKKDSKPGEKATNESKAKENSRTADAIITKRTPKSLLKDRSKNNRLSLSTPRRRNSHVRALDFDEKTPEHTTSRKIPQSCTRPKSSAVQGLFQSPPFSGETPPVTLVEPTPEPAPEPRPVRTHVSVPPIATRSPAPKLQGNWNKVAGIGAILCDSESSPEKSQSSNNLSTIAEEKDPPKSWDSDLRKIVGDVPEEDDTRPKSAKKNRRRNSIKNRSFEEPKSAKKSTPQKQVKITPPPQTNLKPKTNIPAKTSPELLARIRELQTPCKHGELAIPPTPRVVFATPGNACLVKIGSGREFLITDPVNTPDFPPTPCIVFTPKIVEEEEHEKKPSPYYEPSEDITPKEIFVSEKVVKTTTVVTTQRKNVVELKESKAVEITKFGVVEENMTRKEIKEVESTSEDNSKEIIEEESMASADTMNTDSDSDSDSDSNSSTSSSSSNSSSSNSSSCSSNASSPVKSMNVSHHDNSTTESEVDSPQKEINSREELERVAENSPKKEKPAPKVAIESTPAVQQQRLTSTISAIITNEKPVRKTPAKPKIINVQTIEPPTIKSEQLTRAAKLSMQLEEKRQRVMAKFKQTTISKRPVTVRRVTAKKPEVVQPVKTIAKQEPAKKVKPTPKKKVPVVNTEEVKPKVVQENEKENLKAKVEQVKRDLFTPGDEAEQRTTRSQSARKSIDENPPLPGVLECLQLIPANKTADESILDQTVEGLSNSQTNSLEVSFVYDDSVPIKKRKRNYSSSELENEYAFTFPDEDEVRVMKVVPYEEIFKMAPKVVKKKSPKKSPIKAKRKITRVPLAASSPLKKDKLQKNKSVKRKASPIKEEKQVEKKPKVVDAKANVDPQALFKKINVLEFLKKVHK